MNRLIFSKNFFQAFFLFYLFNTFFAIPTIYIFSENNPVLKMILIYDLYIVSLLLLIITIYYLIHAIKNEKFETGDKILWFILIFSFNIFAIWFYHKRHIENNEPTNPNP